MTGLAPVTGSYRLYLKSISKGNLQAHFWKLAPTFLCAAILARETEVFVTESLEVFHQGQKVPLSRVYYWAKGAQVPELMEIPAEGSLPLPENNRPLEV